MPLPRAERTKRGRWLEDCTETALKELKEGIPMLYERRAWSDPRPDFIVTMQDLKQFEIELKNWGPTSQRWYAVKREIPKRWSTEVRILIISSYERPVLDEKATNQLMTIPYSVVFSLGRTARSSDDREIIDSIKQEILWVLKSIGWLKKWN